MPVGPQNYFPQHGLMPAYANDQAVTLPITLAPNQTLFRGTVLGEQTGSNGQQTITTTGTPTGGTFTLSLGGFTSGPIPYNATAAQLQTALLAMPNLSSNAVQSLSLTSYTGGTFFLTYGSQQTAPILYNAPATGTGSVQKALEALPNIGVGNVVCSGGQLNSAAVTITFQGALAGVQVVLPFGIQTFLLQGAGTAAVTVVNTGSAGGNIVATGGALPTGIVVNFQNQAGNQIVAALVPTSTGLTGGSSPAAVVTRNANGSPGTPGVYAAYVATNTDGSQVPKCLLEFDAAVDANGNITLGLQTGGQGGGSFQQTVLQVPAWFKGYFRTSELVGLDAAGAALLGKIVQGDLANPLSCILRVT